MSRESKYNIFIFFSSLSRGILELYSSIMLFNLGFNIQDIYLFFTIYSFVTIFINFITIYIGNKYNYNILLIISSIIYILSFYYLINMNNSINNLIIFSILLSISYGIFNIIRHYYGLRSIKDNYINRISIMLIFNYIAIIIASYIGSFIKNNNILVIIVLITSIIGIIPLFMYKDKDDKMISYNIKSIDKRKILFFIVEQSKVIFLSLQPLYLYINLNNNIRFIGIFNIVLSIISIIFMYYFSKKINLKYFVYFNILFSIVLLFKINIFNKNLLMIVAFFEAIGIKIFELVSHNNLYNIKDIEIKGYILIVETIFNITKFVMFFVFYLFDINLKLLLIICIVEIIISSFILKKV